VNGTDTAAITEASGRRLLMALSAVLGLEFVIHANDETEPLWAVQAAALGALSPANISLLHDASMGLGVRPTGRSPPPHPLTLSGYAGGIGPPTIDATLRELAASNGPRERPIWIDMESGVRRLADSGGGGGFALEKVEACLAAVAALAAEGIVAIEPPLSAAAR
jgi:hypothetical protein